MIVVQGVKLYTIDEVAQIIGTSRWTVQRMRSAGKIRFVKVGKAMRASSQSIESYLTGADVTEKMIDEKATAKLSAMLDRLK